MRIRYLALTMGAASAASLAGAAHAAQGDPIADPILAECRAETETQARINCLEAAVADLASRLPQERRAEILDPQEPAARGLGAEQVMAAQNRRAPEDDPENPDNRLEARVIDFSRTNSGNYIFILDNDQVWAQQDFDRTMLSLADNESYQIEVVKGFLSGYRMRFPELNRLVKVRRLR